MRTRTTRRTIRIPLQALGLSLLFAGTALATSAPSMTATSMVTRAAPSTRVISGPPHQVAPPTDPDSVRQLALPARSFNGVPHQVGPAEDPNQGLLTTPTAVSTRLFSGVPHQAAPVAGPNDDLGATPPTTRSFNGVPHQAALPQ